jgi:hypothetical protein
MILIFQFDSFLLLTTGKVTIEQLDKQKCTILHLHVEQ